MKDQVKVELKKQVIPSYTLGKPEINPVFFEKRVYQGSSGKVYPVPFIDKVYDHTEEIGYDMATLENKYVRLSMLPEIGGRIFEGVDKSNGNYDFFYRQQVIKPALVGLAGPWISGGVEFNWPQHHRPGTYLPSDIFIEEENDGAKTVWMSEYDPIHRMKGMHGIRIRPDSALIELRGRLFNRTPFTQTFLWWANVAVRVHEEYQSFFPPDVHYVADHAVRAMSSFPFAENNYYGIPYHERPGKNDLRKYENIIVPTSYMVCDTKYSFFGGYDFKANGGFVHVADRHIAPGKKQWTWGSAEFGKAWDRELTDVGGPYFELMAGVYTDNQPDFSYLLPYETKRFSQFWWSYKNIGPVQNANKELAIRLTLQSNNRLDVGVAASRTFNQLQIRLWVGSRQKIFKNINISPDSPWIEKEQRFEPGQEYSISLSVMDLEGLELLTYSNIEVEKVRARNVASEPVQPEGTKSPGELELIGEHLELYRHPTRSPEPYWEEAVRLDPNNYKSMVSLGKSDLKKGKLEAAKRGLKEAIDVVTRFHPNPASGEAHYYFGLACLFLGETEEAYGAFYKSTWNHEWHSAGYYQLARIDCLKGDYDAAIEHTEASLDTNRLLNSAQVLKSIAMSEKGDSDGARIVLEDLQRRDPLDQWANYQMACLTGQYHDFLASSRNDAQTIIDIAFEYAEIGKYQQAVELLLLHLDNPVSECAVPNPMGSSAIPKYLLAWLYDKLDDQTESLKWLKVAEASNFDYFFPSRINEQLLLEWAKRRESGHILAAYGLGNYYFNLARYQDAIDAWEFAVDASCEYATLYRNLGIAYWNIHQDGLKADEAFAHAISLNARDMRIQYEYDQLKKKMNVDPEKRLSDLQALGAAVLTRDDFTVELAALYNFSGQYLKVLELLESRNFHPWEGGEGQVLKQYSHACLRLGQSALMQNDGRSALDYFEKSLNTPDSLGEKYHPLQAKAHINYWKGRAYQVLGDGEKARSHFEASAKEKGDFIDMAVSTYSELSYYSAMALKELGKAAESKELLESIRSYAQAKLTEEVKIDYFATSLPLLLVFDDDLQKRNAWEAKYLEVLAEIGLSNFERARELLRMVLELNAMHIGAREALKSLDHQ